VALAYLAFAAGLLLGSGGAIVPGLLISAGTTVVGVVRRLTIPGALGILLGAGAVLGRFTAASDAACAARFEADGATTVRLREPASRGASARGFAQAHGCRVPIRIRVVDGEAPAGADVRAVGPLRQQGQRLQMPEARIRLLAEPGLLAGWRTRTGALIDTLYGEHAALAKALVIADERDIDPEFRARFADAGIIHMVSVSGLHVAVLAEGIVLFCILCRIPARRAEVAATVVVAVFVAFVGAPAPAVRSASMYAALVLSRRLQRPTSPWALLALGAAIPLVEPRVVEEIGYHLSVTGMAALVAAGSLWRRLPVDRLPAWGRRVGRETLATVVASAVTAPIVAWHFGRVSLAAPLTNLVVAPLFALAQPALFLSVVLAPLRPVARLVADGTGLLLVAIDRVAAIGAAIPYSAIDVMPSAATAWLVAGSATALLAACASRHWARPLLVAVAGVGAALWWPVLRPASSSMEVHVIDVGQGDAIAIRTPRARWILIDAGDAWRTGDAGARIVAPYLRRRGGTVALLVLSHPHADHIGGAASVITRVPVATIWDGGFVQSSAVYADVLTAARGRGVEWRRAPSGHTVDVDGVRLTVLAPDSVSLARSRDANEASVVVLAEYHGVRLLFTGDLERAEELELVRQHGESLRAHVLKVGHHGSATSTTPAFLSAVAPRLALVSVGAGNRYGHPDPGVLERLRASGTQVLRTDDDGTIVVSIGGGWMRVGSDEGRWLVRTGRVPGER
jgi:competence protein ComEC